MNVRMNGPTVFLDRSQMLELVDAAGAVASVRTGCLWITMENDSRDIVLGTGDSWTIDRNGRTLVHAKKPSTVRLTDALPTKGRWKDRLRGALGRSLNGWALPRQAPYY